ncbi:MAG: exonuclease SbcCD subunit D [Dehalococcoidales bacterium]|jgi:exonuclease SbcD
MKIIHFADLHLGVESYGHVDAETGLSSRFRDFLDSFDRLVDYAIEKKADLVLFCGDAYKSRDPSQTQQREFARRVKKLAGCGIPVFLLVGNHDLPNASGRATTTEIFDTLAIENVFVAGHPGLFPIATPSGIIQVVALPWLKRSNVVGKEEASKLDFAQINQKMQEILGDVIDKLSSELDPALPAVLAAHVWVQGARVGSEEAMSIGQEHMLLVSAVNKPCFDYVALGHIHRHQVLHEHPPVVYAGSLERLDFGDADDEKGFYVVDIEHTPQKRWTGFEFRGVAGRRFLTVQVNLTSEDRDPTETVLKVIESSSDEICGNIVRLEINIPQECEGRLDENAIRQAASETYYFSIVKNVKRSSRPRLGESSVEALSPTQTLWAYIELKRPEYSRETADKLVELGTAIIQSNRDS